MSIASATGALTVDIATRVVHESENIFIIQPGQNYWLYELFHKRRRVFLDFPGLELDFSVPPPPDPILRRMIVRSIAIAEWIDGGSQGLEPPTDLQAYVGKDRRKRLGRYVAAIKRLYWDLKPGAIIVVPGRNFFDEVLIGEIVGSATTYSNEQLYDKAVFPARKVRWLRTKPRSTFSPALRDKFGKPNPITLLERSLRGEILRAGFDQYAFDGEYTARLNTTEEDFTTLDDYDIQTFINYVSGVLIAVDLGHTDEVSFIEAIHLLKAHRNLALDLKQNINSIGFQRLVGETVKPLVIGVLLAAAIASATDGAAAAPKIVAVTNSVGGKDDACTVEVAKRVEDAMKLMKLEDWKRVCENARDAHSATGISTTMRAKNQGKAKS